jgi:hypothetical protein
MLSTEKEDHRLELRRGDRGPAKAGLFSCLCRGYPPRRGLLPHLFLLGKGGKLCHEAHKPMVVGPP